MSKASLIPAAFLRHKRPPHTTRPFSSCPFQTLGLKSPHHHHSSRAPLKSNEITYDQVRVAFRKLALVHHPDTADKESTIHDGSLDGNKCDSFEFKRIREAFEAIAEGPGGMAVLRSNHSQESLHDITEDHGSDSNNSNNVRSNHHDSNNTFLHPSSNPSILHEVAEAADMSPGGLDRGGMWQYAKMVRDMAQEGGLPPLRVEGGEVEKRGRRRRRK